MMDFRTTCTAASLISLPFGVAFLFAPGPAAALYGAVGSDPAFQTLGRYFGAEVLMYAAALWGLRALLEPVARRGAAGVLAAATAAGLGVSLHGVVGGMLNTLGWSSVGLYGFFALMWLRLAFASAPAARRA